MKTCFERSMEYGSISGANPTKQEPLETWNNNIWENQKRMAMQYGSQLIHFHVFINEPSCLKYGYALALLTLG